MKRLYVLLAVIIVYSLLSLETYAANNLVTNPSFEEFNGSNPVSWSSTAYNKSNDVTKFNVENGQGHTGNKCIAVTNTSANDARYSQEVAVKENTYYKLSCWAKTENIGKEGKGANISIEGKLETSEDLKGTNSDWRQLEMYAQTGPGINSIKITVGIGGYSAINTGKAYFDDIEVVEVSNIPNGAVLAKLSNDKTNSNDSNTSTNKKNANLQNQLSQGPNETIWLFVLISVIIIVLAFLYYNRFSKNGN